MDEHLDGFDFIAEDEKGRETNGKQKDEKER